jgi:hypothetical protein
MPSKEYVDKCKENLQLILSLRVPTALDREIMRTFGIRKRRSKKSKVKKVYGFYTSKSAAYRYVLSEGIKAINKRLAKTGQL